MKAWPIGQVHLDITRMYVHFVLTEVFLRWICDPEKDRLNRRNHGLPLSIGEVAIADPLALLQPDPHQDGDRWNTIGLAADHLLFVVHTCPDDEMVGRIVSVRKATKHERKVYENG